MIIRRQDHTPLHPRYRILNELGRGGSSDVYLAADRLAADRPVALKIASDGDVENGLLREFRLLRQLRHASIIRVLDYGRMPLTGQAFLALEHTQGQSLDDKATALRRDAPGDAAAEILHYLRAVAQALEYLHARGLLHLDVKPQNILVTPEGGVKLIDFGLYERKSLPPRRPSRGTIHYMAPECFGDDQTIDERTDLYAFGVCFHRLLTGKFPISGTSVEEIARRQRQAQPRVQKKLPPEVRRIVERLLEKSPADRFQNARELSAALSKLSDDDAADVIPVSDELVGREKELQSFLSWLEQATTECVSAFAITGPLGSGKTRLLEHFETELVAAEFMTLTLKSADTEAAASLITSLANLDEDKLSRPTLKTRPRLVTPDGSRKHNWASTVEALQRHKIPRLALVIDADAGVSEALWRTLQGLAGAVHQTSGAVQLAITIAAVDLEEGIDQLAGEKGVSLCLTGVNTQAATQIARGLAPRLSSTEIARIVERADGLPGRLTELCDDRAAIHSAAQQDDDEWPNLSAEDKEVASALAAAIRPYPAKVFADVTGLPLTSVRRSLKLLCDAGLVKSEARRFGIRDNSAKWHRHLKPSDVGRYRGQFGRRARDLAFHDLQKKLEAAIYLVSSNQVEEHDLTYAIDVFHELQSQGRVDAAFEVSKAILASQPRQPYQRHLLEEQGDLHQKIGELEAAVACYEAVLDDDRLPVRARVRLLRKSGGARQRRGDTAQARRLLEAGLEELEGVDDVDEHLHILNEIAALDLYQNKFAHATTFAHHGLEILASERAQDLGPATYSTHALNLHSVTGHTFLRQLEYDRAIEEYSKCLEHARDGASEKALSLILNNLGVAYMQANRLPEALKVYKRAAGLAGELGDDTAKFSIECNVASILARVGDLAAAREKLANVEQRTTLVKDSTRARLLVAYTRAQIERIELNDAAEWWHEAYRHASELEDPLFTSYALVNLLENDLLFGRWLDARRTIERLDSHKKDDEHLAHAVETRAAYLEALCGHRDAARALIDSKVERIRSRPAKNDRIDSSRIWDRVFVGATLMELADYEGAAHVLEDTRQAFRRYKQPAGIVECCLLLADTELRRSSVAQAEKWMQEVRGFVEAAGTAVRASTVRLELLEQRARLASAKGATPPGSGPGSGTVSVESRLRQRRLGEWEWLGELIDSEESSGGPASNWRETQERFASRLDAADKNTYLQRNHRLRLGLDAPPAYLEALELQQRATQRLAALRRLGSCPDLREAIESILAVLHSPGGALFCESSEELTVVCTRRSSRESQLTALRPEALRNAASEFKRGYCAAVRSWNQPRLGVLYIELAPGSGHGERRECMAFLDVAAQILACSFNLAARPAQASGESTASLVSRSRTHEIASPLRVTWQSPRMKELMTLVHRTRESNLPVLISGESGSGKDYLARYVHSISQRRQQPFVAHDCSAVPMELFEAELFGYEAGAFTGAEKSKPGYLEAANHGTFYLDHVDSLPLEVQSKLLRAIESGRVRPLGGRKSVELDLRVIASSQRDLRELCRQGQFRSDLYFRLARITLDVPPLRERAEDIPSLIEQFQRQLASPLILPTGAIETLKAHTWPGNVRELESVLRRLALTAVGSVSENDLRQALGIDGHSSRFPRWILENRTFDEVVQTVKREYMLHLFERFGGKLDSMARELGMTKRNLYIRLQQLNIKPTELRKRDSG